MNSITSERFQHRLKRVLFLIGILAILVIAFLHGARRTVVVLLVLLGGLIIFSYNDYKNDYPLFVIVGVILVTVLSGLATFFGWWAKVPNFDRFIHFAIHFFVGYMAIHLFQRWFVDSRFWLVVAALSLVIAFGFVIEFVEFVLWNLLNIDMAPPGEFYIDTMDDFLWNIFGGGVGILLALSRNNTSSK